MINNKISEQILKEYEKKSESIIQEMMRILLRTQREKDDEAYKKVLNIIENLEKQKGDQ